MFWPEVEITSLSPFTFLVDRSRSPWLNGSTLMLFVDELPQDEPSACALITVQVCQAIALAGRPLLIRIFGRWFKLLIFAIRKL